MRNKGLDRKIASTEAGASLQGGEPQAIHTRWRVLFESVNRDEADRIVACWLVDSLGTRTRCRFDHMA
jgi:hypothetical protein